MSNKVRIGDTVRVVRTATGTITEGKVNRAYADGFWIDDTVYITYGSPAFTHEIVRRALPEQPLFGSFGYDEMGFVWQRFSVGWRSTGADAAGETLVRTWAELHEGGKKITIVQEGWATNV